jgi:hypothetical protein
VHHHIYANKEINKLTNIEKLKKQPKQKHKQMFDRVFTQIHIHIYMPTEKETKKQIRKNKNKTFFIVLLHNCTAPRVPPCARRPHANPILIQQNFSALIKVNWSDFMNEIFEFLHKEAAPRALPCAFKSYANPHGIFSFPHKSNW